MKAHCGACHDCGHALIRAVSTDDGRPCEWCPDCGVARRYRRHGFRGRGVQASACKLQQPRPCANCAGLMADVLLARPESVKAAERMELDCEGQSLFEF